MSRNFKKIAAIVTFAAMVLMCAVMTFAAPNPDWVYAVNADEYAYRALVIDDADLLSETEELLLYEEMEGVLEYGHAVFYSTNLSKGTNYEKHCEDTYYQLFGNDPGVIFQIDMGNRKLTLSASTEMETLLHSERDSIVDNIYKKASNADYYGCAKECFREICVVLNDGKIAHQMKYIDNAIIALILGLILNFLFVFSASQKKKPAKAVLGKMVVASTIAGVATSMGKRTRRHAPKSSGGSSGGRSFSGGGSSGGGGFSGGSSSHGF